jgi:23S rRNA pseudoU1915 N3-methylase RlmH
MLQHEEEFKHTRQSMIVKCHETHDEGSDNWSGYVNEIKNIIKLEVDKLKKQQKGSINHNRDLTKKMTSQIEDQIGKTKLLIQLEQYSVVQLYFTLQNYFMKK